MERLTEKDSNGNYKIEVKKLEYWCTSGDGKKPDTVRGQHIDKLAEYEDLEEQGKMLKLPCAVGDTVYAIELDEENFTHFHCPRKISEYKFNLQMLDLLEMFGKCIFLTREAAEAALKELCGIDEMVCKSVGEKEE